MTEVARLSVVVDANIASAASKLKAVDSQFHRVTGSATAMDRQVRMTSASTNAVMASNARAAKSSSSTTARAAQQTAQANQRAASSVARSSGQMRRSAAGAAQGLGMGMTATQGAVVAAGYALGKTVSIAANFDSAMRNVNSIAKLSEGQFQSLKTQVNALAGPTAQTPQTLAEGMYQLVSSGFNASDAMTVLKASSIAATAGLTDAETATTAIAGALNAYQLKASDAQQVSDLLFTTVDKGVLTFGDLAQGLGPVLPFASKLGVDLKQVGAMLSILTIKGVPAAEAMTYTKGAMAQLVKPSSDLKQQFKELGVASGADLVRKTGSLQGALEALYKSVDGNDQKFSKLFPDIRGMSAAFAVTGKGADEAARMLSDFNVKAGRTKDVFKEQQKGDAFGFKQLNADVQQVANTYGQKLTPAISTAAKGASLGARGLGSKIGQEIVSGMTKHVVMGAAGMPGIIAAQVGDVKKITGKLFGGGGDKKVNVKVTPKVTKMPRIQDLIPGSPKVNQLVTIKANNNDVKKKVGESNNLLDTIKGVSPKIKVSSNAPQVSTTAQNAIDSVTGKTVRINVVTTRSGGNASTVVNGGRLPGQAMGGLASGGLVRVGEQGPEVVELPEGARVWSAGATRRMDNGMGLPGYAKGGWVKPKRPSKRKGESKKSWRKRLDRYQERVQKWRDKIDRHNSGIDRRSGIRDSRSDKAIAEIPLTVDKDGNTVEDTAAIDAKNVARAKRHLAEAQKKKGKDRAPAVAAARAELAQARKTQALNAAQVKAIEDNTEAIKAQADAMKSLSDSINESNRIASTTHNAWGTGMESALRDWVKGQLGGQPVRTLGPPAVW